MVLDDFLTLYASSMVEKSIQDTILAEDLFDSLITSVIVKECRF